METSQYYVNKKAQPTGEHEVHKGDCSYLPEAVNRLFLGYHSYCRDAVKEARKAYENVDGCFHCSNECHSR